jgi:hypothetical protein
MGMSTGMGTRVTITTGTSMGAGRVRSGVAGLSGMTIRRRARFVRS